MPRQPSAWRLPSWNGLLAMGNDLAIRTGWTGQERTVSWTLSARPSAVPTARRLVTARLSAWQLDTQAGPAQLLAAHLVGEALRHGAEKIKVTLSAEDDLLRCEVDEQRHGHDVEERDLTPLEELACCWGAAGTVVWFELRVRPHI
ncbi:hypothetical protein [Nonomuraea sp. SYSU D8015]|uniref:hypothetical protein n=1 Tax=Nonomuraea sp. SYSU D8015 TaxID=2593644 RepID=UPI00166161C9|nr:hypothetical protein [Nonomuraea sp. SYSU D8015]